MIEANALYTAMWILRHGSNETMTMQRKISLFVRAYEAGDVDITDVTCAGLFQVAVSQMPTWLRYGSLRTAMLGCVKRTTFVTRCIPVLFDGVACRY